MSILFSGDFHANFGNEIDTITKNSLIKKYGFDNFSDIKYHIILGDGGFMPPENHAADLVNEETLAQRPFPVLSVIGNHEPILGMSNVPEIDIGIGEKVLLVNDNDPFIAYLKRGKIYAIDGLKILVLGGALSIDNGPRWAREYWSEEEKCDVFELLKNNNTFDLVLSHTGPEQINKTLFRYNSGTYIDEVALLNDEIHRRIQFREWWCGHWHRERYYHDEKTNRGYQYLYQETKILKKLDNEIVVYNEYGRSERNFYLSYDPYDTFLGYKS
jgi:hypothetical protein